MRPKPPELTISGDLFRARLDQIINRSTRRCGLRRRSTGAGSMTKWRRCSATKAGLACRRVLRSGFVLLKQIYGLSDEQVCDRWTESPYFQYFTGEEFFRHEFPHERSDLTH